MALEQAEQLFAAARTVEPAARPLLLFYGLSQAGRAIAACAKVATFKLSGHGISSRDLDASDLGSVRLVDQGNGSFTQLAAILGSRSLPQEVPLRDLWSVIPEVHSWPIVGSTLHLMGVTLEKTPPTAAPSLRVLANGMPRQLIDPSNPVRTESAIRAWLQDYPALDGYAFATPGAIPPSGPRSWNDRNKTFGCDLDFQLLTGTEWERFEQIAPFAGRTLKPAATRLVHPRLPGNDQQLHPLLAWWSCLYALSMLARYNPDQWVAHIDVNGSGNAVAIEVLLEKAIDTVPELVLATIEDVA